MFLSMDGMFLISVGLSRHLRIGNAFSEGIEEGEAVRQCVPRWNMPQLSWHRGSL